MSKESNNGLRFEPWIGKNYKTYVDGKILLIGESHYLDEELDPASNFTTAVIKQFLQGHKLPTPFFQRIGNIFDSNDYNSIWENIAFANLIQAGLSEAKSQPTVDDIATINPTFEILLKNLKPDKVLVFSKRLWNNWLTEEDATHVKEISANNKKGNIWEYQRNGKKTLAMGINHASRMYGKSWSDWVPLVKKFINEN